MIVLKNYNQCKSFEITLQKVMRLCLKNFNNNDFELNRHEVNFTYDNYKLFTKQFRKNTAHNIKDLHIEILYKPNNACYLAHVSVTVNMHDGSTGFYRYKVFQNGKKLDFVKQF